MNALYKCPITKTRFFISIFLSNNKPTYTLSHIDLSLHNIDFYFIKNINENIDNTKVKCKKCDGNFPVFNNQYDVFSNECFIKYVKNYMLYHQL